MCWTHGERNQRRRRSERRECVSDLEGEETKEFIDLGFVSTKEDLNSELPEILPGHGNISPLGRREYICWKHGSFKLCGDTNINDSLKWWARSVACNLK
ncbi:hypothetical protein BRARA_H01957 [Brassica rapa]|uniref:Uncharacterized protein n=1 Tax=Brassica campestris TaxID=3711 RepID=A0A397YCU9_BRACM|nr:hypothetical protein BRARA_H01957 [Brassica rapa]